MLTTSDQFLWKFWLDTSEKWQSSLVFNWARTWSNWKYGWLQKTLGPSHLSNTPTFISSMTLFLPCYRWFLHAVLRRKLPLAHLQSHWIRLERKSGHYVWNIGFACLCTIETTQIDHNLSMLSDLWPFTYGHQLMITLIVVLVSFLSLWHNTWNKQLIQKKGFLPCLLDLRSFMPGTNYNIMMGSTWQRKLFSS